MNDRAPVPLPEAMLGSVEPHAPLLRMPEPGQLLYKMTRAEDLIRSIEAGYLYFNRVDSYADFPGADPHDGQQVPLDRPGNTLARFQQAPSVSLADYYESSRSRSYACCFSLDNSPHIWANYASGSSIGKVCVVFDFGRLRARLNQTFEPGSAALDYKGLRCHQLFSVNYGVVEYVTWVSHRENVERLPNPIRYLYLKDRKYTPENELRVSLSAAGVGQFVLADGSTMSFPKALHATFDYKGALADGTITRILCDPDGDTSTFLAKLERTGIHAGRGSDVPK